MSLKDNRKFLSFIFAIFLLVMISFTYYKYVILEDFEFFTDEEVFFSNLEK